MRQYRVVRQETFGRNRRQVIYQGYSLRTARNVADNGTSGPDGIAVGCRVAEYYVERKKA